MISDAKDRILEYGRAAITCDWSFVGLTVKDMSKLYCPLATGKDRVYSNSYDLRRFGEDPTCRIAPTNANGDFNHSLSFVPGT